MAEPGPGNSPPGTPEGALAFPLIIPSFVTSMAKLVAQTGPTAGREYPLRTDVVVIGRQASCDVQVIDNLASRAHCQLQRYGDFWVLTDNGSRNGTKLNDQRVSERQVVFGDRIRIGEVILLLVREPGDKELGDLLTRYQVQDKIGEGGMGVVYKAVQVSMQRTVALKVLSPRFGAKQRFVDQFIREARAAGALNHQNIIQVHDVGTENGVHFFSMEFVDGPTCSRMLRRQGPFRSDEALEVGFQVAKALEYAHQHRLIHQDIKPDNIMVGADSVVKLADLGISRTFEEAERSGEGERRVMGTPCYMAPEAAQGRRIDHRVDLYGLGATLYHLLTGKAPFHGATPAEVLRAQVSEEPVALRQLNPEVPEAVARLVERLMAKDPDARHPDAAAVQEEIRQIWAKGGQETGALGTDTHLLRRYREAKERPPGLSGDALQTPESSSRSGTAGSGGEAERRSRLPLMVAAAALLLAGGGAAAFALRPAPAPAPAPALADPAPAATAGTISKSSTVTAAPLPAIPAGDRSAAAALALDRAESLLTQSVPDAVAAHTQLAAVPLQGLDAALLQRRGQLTARLDQVVHRQRLAQLDRQSTAVMADVDRLCEERSYDLALNRLDAVVLPPDAAGIRQRLMQRRQQVVEERDEAVRRIEQRLARLVQAKDADGLRALQDELPRSWLGGPVGRSIEQAIAALRQARAARLDAGAEQCAKALAQWDFAALDRALSLHREEAKGSPAGERMTACADAGKRLQELTGELDGRLRAAGGVVLASGIGGFPAPDLVAAGPSGIDIQAGQGATLAIPWKRIKPAELSALVAAVMPERSAHYANAIETLARATAGSGK